MLFLFFLVKLCCQAVDASLYSTPTPCECKTNGQQHIITANKTLGWRREETVERMTQDKERNRVEECRAKRSGCQGIDVSLQLSFSDICHRVSK